MSKDYEHILLSIDKKNAQLNRNQRTLDGVLKPKLLKIEEVFEQINKNNETLKNERRQIDELEKKIKKMEITAYSQVDFDELNATINQFNRFLKSFKLKNQLNNSLIESWNNERLQERSTLLQQEIYLSTVNRVLLQALESNTSAKNQLESSIMVECVLVGERG